jgi:hypothetical protein
MAGLKDSASGVVVVILCFKKDGSDPKNEKSGEDLEAQVKELMKCHWL